MATATRIDRLARSTLDLFGIVKRVVDAKAQFRSLAEPWADTGTSTGRLMLAVLGGLADVERDLIRTRIAEGRSRAKAQGKHMGRSPTLARRSRKRPPDAARKALLSTNSPAATPSAYRHRTVAAAKPLGIEIFKDWEIPSHQRHSLWGEYQEFNTDRGTLLGTGTNHAQPQSAGILCAARRFNQVRNPPLP